MDSTNSQPSMPAAEAISRIQRVVDMHPHRDWRVVIRKQNPGALTAQQSTEVQAIFPGIDWEQGRIIIQPAQPMTELTPAEVADVVASVRKGTSWHAMKRQQELRDRIGELEAELAALRAESRA